MQFLSDRGFLDFLRQRLLGIWQRQGDLSVSA